MNWTAIGAIGEILGAAGVIITLVYLARQVRQNTRATKLSTAQSIATAARDWNRPLLLDPELAWTFQVGTEDPTQLDEKEQARFIELCFSLFRMFEDAPLPVSQRRPRSERLERLREAVRRVCQGARIPGLLGETKADLPRRVSRVHRRVRGRVRRDLGGPQGVGSASGEP